MAQVSYVFPNLTIFTRGGRREGLEQRWARVKACALPCRYVEVPAHPDRGRFLSDADVRRLYGPPRPAAKDINYVLHTEYRDGKIHWNDPSWSRGTIDGTIRLCTFLGAQNCAAIELHPGTCLNGSFDSILDVATELLARLRDKTRQALLVLLENRPGQAVHDADTITRFWDRTLKKGLETEVGVCLDVRQLYTATGPEKLLREIGAIPLQAIKAVHVHGGPKGHQCPMKSPRIEWRAVFARLSCVEGNLLVNPEVHRERDVQPTIRFCERLLR